MIVNLKRNEEGKPMLSIDIYNEYKFITEEQYTKIKTLVDSKDQSASGDEYIVRTYLKATKEYPKYFIGEHIIYIDRGDYLIGMIQRVSEAVKDYYYVDFIDGEPRWLEAEYLHKIANGDSYTFLV